MKKLIYSIGILLSFSAQAQIAIDTSFAGGNAIIEKISGDTVYFRPDLRDTEGEWFYWYFRAMSNQPQTWYFKSTRKNTMTKLGATYSTDGGMTWQWVDSSDHVSDDLFRFNFTEQDQAVRFAVAPPYTQANFNRFITPYRKDSKIRISTLCKSKQGRDVEKLVISNFNETPKQKLVIVARAHACEMMSSYVVEGIITSLLTESSLMKRFLETTEILIVPFMDKDGVENGDQGKNRLPRDHNRDYQGKSIYATTRTLRKLVPEWTTGLPWVGIDLHNPFAIDEGNEHIFIVGNSNPAIEKEQKRFANTLITESRGALPLQMNDLLLAHGTSWNTGSSYTKGWPFSKWASSFTERGMYMSTTLEFPFALAHGKIVTPTKARAFGQDFIYALAKFMEEKKK